MIRAAALSLFLLTGCGRLLPEQQSDPGTMMEVAKHSVEIAGLKAEVARLKEQQEQSDRLLSKTADLAQATSSAHDGLRQTVNKNVDIDNKRNDATQERINMLAKRVYGE